MVGWRLPQIRYATHPHRPQGLILVQAPRPPAQHELQYRRGRASVYRVGVCPVSQTNSSMLTTQVARVLPRPRSSTSYSPPELQGQTHERSKAWGRQRKLVAL